MFCNALEWGFYNKTRAFLTFLALQHPAQELKSSFPGNFRTFRCSATSGPRTEVGVFVLFLWWCGGVFVVVRWCFCGGVAVFFAVVFFAVVFLWWCGGVFVVVWRCFCGGVLVFFAVVCWCFSRWCGGVFVVVWRCFCGGVAVFLWWCFCGTHRAHTCGHIECSHIGCSHRVVTHRVVTHRVLT